MTIVLASTPAVHSANATPAADWPAWTDEIAFWPTDSEAPADAEPIGPTIDDDAFWAAETRDVEPDDDGPTDAEWDAMAEESAAVDSLARGYCHA